MGFESGQYTEGIKIAQNLHNRYGDTLRYTGHSLGGGIAAAAAIITGGSATTFNAAGVHSNTIRGFSRSNGNILAYHSDYDVLYYANLLTPSSASVPGTRIPLGDAGMHDIGSIINRLEAVR